MCPACCTQTNHPPSTGPPTLELQFNNNTPDVDGSDIRVSFVSNNPLESAVCAINGPNPISGSCMFAPLSLLSYTQCHYKPP